MQESKKLSIEVDCHGQFSVLVNGSKIGMIFDDKVSMIESVNLHTHLMYDGEANLVRTEIVFANFLGGLNEGDHAEIIESLARAVKALKGLPVKISMRWGCGLEGTSDEKEYLEKYGVMNGLRNIEEIAEKIK